MTEFPKTQLDMYTTGTEMISSQEAQLARLLPPDSLERKYAILDSILQYHKGEVRAWGGEWELRQGPLTAPAWAKPAPTTEVLALELRTNPLGTSFYTPTTYTEQVVLQQISEGKRPALDKIIGFFWAPGTAVAFWHRRHPPGPEGAIMGPSFNDHDAWTVLDVEGALPGLVWYAADRQTDAQRAWGRHPPEEDGRVGGTPAEDFRDQVLPH